MFSLKKSDEIKLISAKEISFDEASAIRQIFKNNINNNDDVDDDDKDGSTVVEKKNFSSLGRKLKSSLKSRLKYEVTAEFDCNNSVDNRKSKNKKKLIEKEKVVVHDNIESTIKISRVYSIKKLFHTPLVSRKKITKETTNNLDDDNDKLKMKLYNINNNNNDDDLLAIDNKSNSQNERFWSKDEPATPLTPIIIDDIFNNLKLKVQQDSDTNINDSSSTIDETIDLKIKLNNSTDAAGNNFCTKKHLKTTLTTTTSSCKVVGALKKDGTYENYM